MGSRNHHSSKRHKNRTHAPAPASVRVAPAPVEKKPPVVYGKPFVLMENDQRATFIYSGGQWVPYDKTIAQCREDSQVQELAQKINGMTRYEVRSPLG